MIDYDQSLELLGVPDQNMPVFKEARVNRLKSIQKISSLIGIAKRLSPAIPEELTKLDPLDQEWEDKMIYPKINHIAFIKKTALLALNTAFFTYNWNIISGNHRMRFLKVLFPLSTSVIIGDIYYNYNRQKSKVELFDSYVKERSVELIDENKYLFGHPSFEKYVYFQEDLKETLNRVHRQANNNKRSDFADSELILQDFITRYSTVEDPVEMFDSEGSVKMYNQFSVFKIFILQNINGLQIKKQISLLQS